jgi:lipid II:glycine glycyltransferase (peptidoglycan interpeptide bridge formation enzyme)
MSNSFLQSNEWAEFQKSLGREVFEYNKEGISAKIIKQELSFHKNYLYIPYGPDVDFNNMTAGFKNPFKNFKDYLRQLAKENKSIFVKVEPLSDNIAQALVEAKGFKKNKKEIQPGRTVVLDINGDEAEILSRMHNKTRYNIKVAEKHGITVSESSDVDAFWKLLKKTTKRDRFSSHPQDYYRKLLGLKSLDVRLFLAYQGSGAVAGAIVLTHGNSGYYLHGASDHEYRSMMAPYMLHWQIIKFLKDKGILEYDFWGIDARKWPGVTRFKLGWGGRTVEHPGSFDMPISKFWYLLYRLYRSIRG